MSRELKAISFNNTNRKDMELLKHVESLGISFGTYVKLLIRRDMEGQLPVSKQENYRGENNNGQMKTMLNRVEDKLDYVIDKLNNNDDIQIMIKR